MRLTHWKAIRSGERLTVTGTDEDGKDAKLTGIDYIMAGPVAGDHVVAVDKESNVHQLAHG